MNDKEIKEVPWTLSDVIVSLVVFIFILTGGALIISGLLGQISPRGGPIIALFVGYIVIALMIFYFAIARRSAGWSDLGFRPFDFARSLGLVVAWFFLVKVISFVYTIIAQRIGLEPSEDVLRRVPEVFGEGTVGFLLAVIVVAVLAPFVEELLFRGFIYPVFRQRWGLTVALVANSLLFGLFHFNLFLFIPITIIGFALAYLYEITDSLGPPIMLHALNNFLSVVLIYYGALNNL